LQARIKDSPWLTAVGVGENKGTPCIVVYVNTLKNLDLHFLDEGWKGFPVVVRKMGSPRLVASYSPRSAAD
jgi:hypothetical protein